MADQQATINHFLVTVRKEIAAQHGTPERSHYPSISALLDGLLESLKPRRRAITDPHGIEREFPDLGVIEVESNVLVLPVEVKSPTVEIKDILDSAQALKYARTFGGGAVLVTNIREFAIGRIDSKTNVLVEEDRVVLTDMATGLENKLTVSTETAAAFVGMLDTACQVRGSVKAPEDLAHLLAFHASRMRDAVEATGNATILLEPIHAAMRDGLHIDIEPDLLVPTVVQTLVYGLFASWLESVEVEDLDWMEMAYRLDVPVFADVLHAALRPQLIRECNLKQHLNATARVLSWVNKASFVSAFDGDAIEYFYEPFLAAFDPLLRDRLGVWYTPKEIADYQIARVDQQIRDTLGVAAGIADSSVYVLDPACGTGTYLASLIRFVYQRNLDNGEAQSVAATRARDAAVTRFIGFEVLPAAFVICHLHLTRVLAQIGAPPLGSDRIRVYLTNALTGWATDDIPTGQTLFPELEAELRDAAVAKHHDPILAVLGNPPYEGYSTADNEEERALLADWIAPLWPVWSVRKHRLNDLYVRFWRMSVNRIVSMTGRGIISFISNRKWLGGRSYPAMREAIVKEFQHVYVDDLHGGVDDRTHPGDQSIFTTAVASGITRGTAIVTAVRVDAPDSAAVACVRRRDLRGSADVKRNALAEFRGERIDEDIHDLTVSQQSRWRFVQDVAGDYAPLDDYLPFYVSGVQPVRDEAVLDNDKEALRKRMQAYFDASDSWEQFVQVYPGFGVKRAGYDGPAVRKKLLNSSFRESRLVRFLYRPFDSRWLYWEPDHGLLNRPRPPLLPYWENLEKQCAMVTPQTPRRKGAPRALAGQQVAGFACAEPDARVFPLYRPPTLASPNSGDELHLEHPDESSTEPTMVAAAWIDAAMAATGNESRREAGEIVFYALLAVLNSPAYLDMLPVEMDDFPPVPLPSQSTSLIKAAETGRRLAELYDPDIQVSGVTTGVIDPDLRPIGVPDAVAGDVLLTYGSYGEAGGKREGADVMWDEQHGWRNIPDEVWGFMVNGHVALPKWLSYRKNTQRHPHQLSASEREQFMYLARRVAAIIRLHSDCDAAWTAAIEAPLQS